MGITASSRAVFRNVAKDPKTEKAVPLQPQKFPDHVWQRVSIEDRGVVGFAQTTQWSLNKTGCISRVRGAMMVVNEMTSAIQGKGTKTVIATAFALAIMHGYQAAGTH